MRAALRSLRRIAGMPHAVASFGFAVASIRIIGFLYGVDQVFDLAEGLIERDWLRVVSAACLLAWIVYIWRGLGQIARMTEPIAEFVAAEHDRHQAFLRMEEARRATEREARGE